MLSRIPDNVLINFVSSQMFLNAFTHSMQCFNQFPFLTLLSLIFSHNFHTGKESGTIASSTSSRYFSAFRMSPIDDMTITSKTIEIEGSVLHALMTSRQADVNV